MYFSGLYREISATELFGPKQTDHLSLRADADEFVPPLGPSSEPPRTMETGGTTPTEDASKPCKLSDFPPIPNFIGEIMAMLLEMMKYLQNGWSSSKWLPKLVSGHSAQD